MTEIPQTPASVVGERGAIGRRSLLGGGALAIPAIMLATSTPAFAASGTTLAFDRSSYSGEGCSTISGARVSATDNGSAKAGVAVTVSLPSDYAFDGGGTTHTGTTGSDGSLTLPDILLPGNSNTSTATATASGAAAATTSLIGSAAPEAVLVTDSGKVTASGVGTSATPLGGTLYLTSDKRVIDTGNNAAVVSTDVAAAGHIYVTTGNTWTIPLRKSDGSCVLGSAGSAERPAAGVPSGSTPVAGVLFHTSDKRIVSGDSGATVCSYVDTWGQMYFNGTDRFVPLKLTDGSFAYLQNDMVIAANSVPSGSTPAAARFWLSSDGRIVEFNGNVWANNVAAHGEIALNPGASFDSWQMPLRKNDGSNVLLVNYGSENATTGVPSGSTPLAHTLFLTSDNRIIDGSNGKVLSRGVTATGDYSQPFQDSSWAIPLTQDPATCGPS